MPEPYLWWVFQTGSTVHVPQSASCELWLWLVRLDWYRTHTLPSAFPNAQNLTRLALPESEISDFLIALIWLEYFEFYSDFLGYQYTCHQVLRKPSIFSTRNIYIIIISCPFIFEHLLLHIIRFINIHPMVVYCLGLLTYPIVRGMPNPDTQLKAAKNK